MPTRQTVGSLNYDEDGFRDLLDAAESRATRGHEKDFLEALRERFSDHGLNTFLSDKQLLWLRAIAGDDDE